MSTAIGSGVAAFSGLAGLSGDLGRLRWRCRRGLLENDLLIERFFIRHGAALNEPRVRGLQALMDLADNDLLDLLLVRREPEGGLDRPEVHEVLALMRRSKTEDSEVKEGASA